MSGGLWLRGLTNQFRSFLLSFLPSLPRRSWQRQQEISACDSAVHYGMHPNMGRGSPEIDILEAMAALGKGVSECLALHCIALPAAKGAALSSTSIV